MPLLRPEPGLTRKTPEFGWRALLRGLGRCGVLREFQLLNGCAGAGAVEDGCADGGYDMPIVVAFDELAVGVGWEMDADGAIFGYQSLVELEQGRGGQDKDGVFEELVLDEPPHFP